MAKQGNIKHYRQTGAAKKPTALPFGEIAIAKDGTLYAGNESNAPVSSVESATNATQHMADRNNPHGVTAEHVGALPIGMNCTGKDFNTLKKAGQYYGYQNMTNAAFQGMCTLEVVSYSIDWIVQYQTDIGTNAVYRRCFTSGTTWSSWVLQADAPAEAVYKPQTGGESVIGVRSFYYPSQCNQNNCFVAAVLVNGKQIQCESTLSAGDISVQCGEVEPKVIVQRYK